MHFYDPCMPVYAWEKCMVTYPYDYQCFGCLELDVSKLLSAESTNSFEISSDNTGKCSGSVKFLIE